MFLWLLDQQHILQQQQLGQALESDAAMSFSQPQMHSFNYDEQTNQLQRRQQQILLDQDYASESVTADYNLDPEDIRKENDNARSDKELTRVSGPVSGAEQPENNIEYGEIIHRRNPTTYFDNKVADDNAISSRFYTILPNRETAEKLAALAAAGNVNSRLIGQLRKQQGKDTWRDEAMPFNHKNDDGDIIIQRDKTTRIDSDQQQRHDQPESDRNMKISQQHHHRQSYNVQNNQESPLRITVPDERSGDYVTNDDARGNVDRKKDDIGDVEYEYEYENENENENENEGGEIENMQSAISLDEKMTSHDNDSRIEFGSRLGS